MIKKIIILSIALIFLSCDSDNKDLTDDLIEPDFNCEGYSEDISFSLKDLNPESTTFDMYIGSDTYNNGVTLFYFSNNEN
tara:strand:- start:547 stop:786 length:240 start_codon:yes stop_codon:yes gene_type:complete